VSGAAIFRDLFGTEEMRALFNDTALIQGWLDAEAALARAEAAVGIVPEEAAEEIARKAQAGLLDPEEIRHGIRDANHPLVPVIRAFAAICEGGAGEYVHWGATTQDIMDTGMVLQLRGAHALVVRRVERLVRSLASLAARERGTLMAGRTHGQHALPVTLGFKLAVFVDEFLRHRERLLQLAPRLLVGQLAGAVGTLASLGEDAEEVRREYCAALELERPALAWHTARDSLAELAGVVSMVAATCERLAQEVILLQKTEVAELFEAHEDANVGSSTLPQKRNPMTAESVVAAARLVRRNAVVALEGMTGQHERDMGPWQAEWAWVPELCINADAALVQTITLVEGLTVDRERMRANLDRSGGLIMAEAAMMRAAERIGRQTAHDLLHELAMRAFEENLSFRELLAVDPRITNVFPPDDIESLLDPGSYLGLAEQSVDAVLARAAEMKSQSASTDELPRLAT
jgi:3-carboxy-cis,cis-muconate cycloisomerase